MNKPIHGINLLYKKPLLACPLFEKVAEEEVDIFMSQAQTICKNYKKNDFIAIIDEPMEGLGIILKGHALLTRENMLGQRTIVTDLNESQMFGEALLFSDRPLWPATIRATEPTIVLFIPLPVFAHPLTGCVELHAQLLLNLLHDLSQKTLQLNKKVHYLTIKSMRQKLFAYFRDLYSQQRQLNLHIPHSREEMADVLNVSRPSMSRELGRLVEEGFITLDRNKLTILKAHEIDLYKGPENQ